MGQLRETIRKVAGFFVGLVNEECTVFAEK